MDTQRRREDCQFKIKVEARKEAKNGGRETRGRAQGRALALLIKSRQPKWVP